ncbi:proton-coupled amino acid transporter-like protein pathetic [Colletes gigas]|uniref:proton-coupled amino acid transporter-like protein pathetic n=1 Tax=Colletes gigas TaxID=935657 RepID=UPI001C9B4B32|nr:proton-coupled amino acid transporter-like protein pathetic [Colletes gigas]
MFSKARTTETADRDAEEDYDPVAHRPPGPLTTDFAAMMHLLKASVGNGMLILPNGFRRSGYVMSIICSIFIGLLCTHTVVGLVIEFLSGFEMDVRVYILALFPFACGLGFVPNLAYLTPFSIVGFLFMLVGICIAFYYLLDDIPDPGRLQAFTHVMPVPMYCNLMLYGLHNVTLCMPLENSMKNPLHLPWIVTFNMLFNTGMYTVFGFLGYNKYMNDTCDTVIKNLPNEEILAQFVKIAISISIFFSLGIAYYVPYSVLWPMIESKLKSYSYGKFMFRLGAVVATTILAIAVPIMVPLLGLLAAISMTTVMLLIPTVIETTTKWERSTRFLLAKNISISFIWMLLLVFGVAEGILSIVREYHGVKMKGC